MPVRAEMDEFDVAEERERFGKVREEAEGRGSDSNDDDDDDSASSSSAAAAPPAGLAEFSRSIAAAIARLGGKAFPKLDWSAPLDAAWLRPGGSLECSNADEVHSEKKKEKKEKRTNIRRRRSKANSPHLSFLLLVKQVLLLLKSSDRISHDLEELSRVAEVIAKGDSGDPNPSTELLQNVSAPTLALRKWHPLRPGAEFRAFFEVGCSLVALCQRDITQHFEGLAGDRRGVLESVARFVRRELAPALRVARPASSASSAPPPSSILASSRLVADLYVHASGKVRLVDLAVPGGTTSPLLFSAWEHVFPERRGEERSGGEERRRQEEEEVESGDDEHTSDAELSLPSSSDDDDDEEEDDSEDDEASERGAAEQQQQQQQQQTTTLPPYEERPPPRVRFRVIGGARSGRIAPGRSLYGAPHDFADGECVEALVERLKATEG